MSTIAAAAAAPSLPMRVAELKDRMEAFMADQMYRHLDQKLRGGVFFLSDYEKYAGFVQWFYSLSDRDQTRVARTVRDARRAGLWYY